MIYEFRTYTLHPRTLPAFLERFGEALPKRQELSPLAAFWYSEIGALNEVIHVWPYENELERSRIRAAAVAKGVWPPKVSEFIADMRSDIMIPQSFSPALDPAEIGPYFEMRSYVVQPGGIPGMAKRWEEYLPGRLKLSPLVGVFNTDVGGLNRWIHIWAYNSLDQRMAVRDKAKKEGIWPPPGDSPVVRQETKILLAAPFSPIR